MSTINDILSLIPEMKTGEQLTQELLVLPEYSVDIKEENAAVRLMRLEDIYSIYIPSDMTKEIYSKLYLTMLRSLTKKNSRIAVMQQNENHKKILGRESTGIIGGSDSFLITGNSGIGKSSAVIKSIMLASDNRIIEIDNPYQKIIPCLVVQCPFDSSVKGLLLEILRKVDEVLDTTYYTQAVKMTATIDSLIGSISQVALNHIGLLIVDEIQNVVKHKGGVNLVAMLTQLINNAGISICMVGTPESENFFSQVDYLARRALGLTYTESPYNEYFRNFCNTVFSYQYVKNKSEITDGIIEWLYEHSSGLVSNVITLIHDAQEIAILSGREILDLTALNIAYRERMSTLHRFINPSVKTPVNKTSQVRKQKLILEDCNVDTDNVSILEISQKAKAEEKDLISVLKEAIRITEIAV